MKKTCLLMCLICNLFAFNTKNGECLIAFPSEPTLIQQSLRVTSGELLYYDVYLAPFQDKGVFMLLIATYPQTIANGNVSEGLQGLVKGIVGHNPENQLIFAKVVDYQGSMAMSFLVHSLSNYFRGQAFMVDNKLFLIAMEGRKMELDEKTFNQFLESFELQEPIRKIE